MSVEDATRAQSVQFVGARLGAEGMAELIVSSLVVAVGVLTAFALEAIAPSEVSDGEGW